MSMAEAFVDLDAIAHNTRLLKDATGGAHLMAMVNANGFGHGMGPVARAVLADGASWLGVTSPIEALTLRSEGIAAPVLCLLCPPAEAVVDLLRAQVDVSVGSVAALEAVAEASGQVGIVAKVHLEADTGLSHGGAVPDDWPQLVAGARKFELAGALRVRGIWSQLANAESLGSPVFEQQLRRFDAARRSAKGAGLNPQLSHLANSAAILQLPRARFDLVRAGIGLYGIEPIPGRTFGLRPAMTVRAQVVLTQRVPAPSGVSYEPDFVTDRATNLALVPLGFADGVPRRSAGRGHFAIHGVRCPIVGRVSMDQVVVDVGDLEVRPGDMAMMLGPGTDGEPTVAEWAAWADTNPHDILTGFGLRVPRRYGPPVTVARRTCDRLRAHTGPTS